MVHYFSTITWCSRDDCFSGIGYKVSPAVFVDAHHRTRRMNASLSLSFYLHTQRRVYRRLPLGLSKSEFSASTTYPRSARAASLSLVVSFYLFFTLSLRLFPQTCPRSVSFPRPVSPMVATSEFESRRVEGLSQPGGGSNER